MSKTSIKAIDFKDGCLLPCGNLPFIMESQGTFGRFSFYGADPYLVLWCFGDNIKIATGSRTYSSREDLLQVLREILKDQKITSNRIPLPFVGGAVGYFGYGLGKLTEKVKMPSDELGLPDLYLAFYNRVIVIDKLTNKRYMVETRRGKKPCDVSINCNTNFSRREKFSKADFLDAVVKAKRYIREGDIYEVNLSTRFYETSLIEPYNLYRLLRTRNPSPFGFYLPIGNQVLISTSPEEFLFLKNGYVRTKPIKGTRKRGATRVQDERIRKELILSKKDDAELAMIVDLERNDLGKVCEIGSVKVTQKKVVEKYPTVFHTVATVEGKLRNDLDQIDLIKATFPGGSVTGAPKRRAMEIISELEPVHRGPYTGAIGYLGLDGAMHLSMAIRIVISQRNQYIFQTGGAIVHDSVPRSEYEEILVKAKAIRDALGNF